METIFVLLYQKNNMLALLPLFSHHFPLFFFRFPSLSSFDPSPRFPWFVRLIPFQILLNVHSDLPVQSPYMGKINTHYLSALATVTCRVTYSICPIFVRPWDLQYFNFCLLPALQGLWLAFIMKQSHQHYNTAFSCLSGTTWGKWIWICPPHQKSKLSKLII